MAEILTVTGVAEYLRVSKHAVYHMVRNGSLPMARLPVADGDGTHGHYRINSDVLEKWAADNIVNCRIVRGRAMKKKRIAAHS